MKNIALITVLVIMASCSNTERKAEEQAENQDHSAHTEQASSGNSKSPKKMAMTNVGDNHVHIEYNSPSKRGRQIFGGLVAFGEVWVTGAPKATTISFTKNVTVGGVNIEKGKYALFTIPGEKEWKVIINKNWDQHLADDYNEADDLVRLTVTPEQLTEPVESLTYEVKEMDETRGSIRISWDDVAISFEVSNG